MFIISAIPLTKNQSLEALSYYSSVTYPVGTLLTIPIRSREITAIVLKVEPVSAAKTALRAATFSLRKLPAQSDAPCLPKNLLDTAAALTKTVPAHQGSILFQLLPPDIRSGAQPYPPVSDCTNTEDSTPNIITALRADRIRSYRSAVREAFAHRGSTLLIVPTAAAVGRIHDELAQGIEKRIVHFSSTQTKAQRQKNYDAFTDFKTAKLIIATPQFAFLDRHDITHIIVDECGSGHYKARTRPYLDFRESITTYARISGRAVLFGDMMPRTDEETFRQEDVYGTYEEHPKRLDFSHRFTIAEHPSKQSEEKFCICTKVLIEAIARTLEQRGSVALFCARRGFAPLVLCRDCGHIFRCPDSGAPYSLLERTHLGETKRYFYSALTGKTVAAADTCPICTSWHLYEQGIGVQQVLQFIHKEFPHYHPILFDHTTATTHNKAQAIARQFYEKKGGLLVATNLALPYLTKPIDTTAVISYEALRSIPTWRAEEAALSNLFAIRERTNTECIVQTRSEPDRLLRYADKALLDEFYKEEINLRQILSYPPFTHFILLTWQGDKESVKADETFITETLGKTPIQCYSPNAHDSKIIRHGLIKIARSDWPDETLMHKLRALPPHIRIEVAPERII